MVTAKFRVEAITDRKGSKYNEATKQYEPCVTSTIELWPVTGGSEENKKFYTSTPSGKIEIGGVNAEVRDCFELGAEYYINFSKAK